MFIPVSIRFMDLGKYGKVLHLEQKHFSIIATFNSLGPVAIFAMQTPVAAMDCLVALTPGLHLAGVRVTMT